MALGASPRGSLSLLKVSRAYAFVQGRDYVIPDDVRQFASDCLCHRVAIKMDHEIEGVKPESVIEEILEAVPVPRGNHSRKA